MEAVSSNKKVGFEYFILDRFEAGVKLTGTEIKAIREGKVNINDTYVVIRNGKPYIVNMFIAKYSHGNIFNHEERRERELLLHKHESIKLATKVKLEGLSIVPIRLYFVQSLIKVEIALCKGKKLADKRQTLKEEDAKRNIAKALKEANRY